MDQPMLPGMEPEEDDIPALERHAADMRNRFGFRNAMTRDAHLKLAAAMKRQRKQDILDFDPNKDEDNLPQFASYCPSRSGSSFKQHTRWHHATRAVKMHSGAVYKWNDRTQRWDRWEVWFDGEYVGR